MKQQLTLAALFAGAAMAHAQGASAPVSPAKKELVRKLLVLQQTGLEGFARNLVERPLPQIAQEVRGALQQLPQEKREAAAKALNDDVKAYVDESVPIVRDHAVKLAPATIGAAMEDKFSEEELRQLLAWFESPVNKRFSQLMPEVQNNFQQKLLAEIGPMMDPRVQALVVKMRADLGLPPPSAAASGAPAASAAAKAPAPSKKASGK